MIEKRPFLTGVIAISLLITMACQNQSKQTQDNENQDTGNVRVEQQPKTMGNTIDARGDSIINLILPPGGGALTILCTLEGTSQHLPVHIKVQDTGEMRAMLVPAVDSLSNIRFNQVILPSGEMSGPYGTAVSFPVHQQGEYQLIIAHNLMAEGGLAKDFTLHIGLKK